MSELARTMEEYVRSHQAQQRDEGDPETSRMRRDSRIAPMAIVSIAACQPPTHQESTATLRESMAELEILRGVAPDLLDALVARASLVDLAPGTPLLVTGQANEKMFLVLSGELRVHLGDRLETQIAVVRRGDSVGELSVIDRRPVSATVVAQIETSLLVIDEPMFWHLVHASHAFAVKLMLKLADRLRANNTTVRANLDLCAELETMALFDALTNVHSRRWLDETLPRLRERHAMDGQPVSIAVVDVDHFKRVNDTYGHQTGDAVLIAIANALRGRVRPTDFVARFGGEEFVIVLPHTASSGAMIAAERIRAAVQETALSSRQGESLPNATISIGVSELRAGDDVEAWLGRADAALYRAKHLGRNRVEVDRA